MRRTGRRAAAGILALALLTALLSACQEGSSTETEESESGYKIYYLNQSETAVDTVDYEPSGSGTEELISEFLEQLAAVPSETDLKAVLTQEAAVASYTLENGQLSLNFGIDYQKMSATKEILTRMYPLSDSGSGVRHLSGRGESSDRLGGDTHRPHECGKLRGESGQRSG